MQITGLGTDQSTWLSVLGIERFPMEQMEENAISFWCKNGDKKAHHAYYNKEGKIIECWLAETVGFFT